MARRPPWLYRFVADRSGQSNTLAVVLLLGITLTGTGVIVTFGGTAVGDTQAAADLGQAEQAMTQFDSRASLVAHGSADVQRATVGTNGQGDIRLDENAGQMKIKLINESGGSNRTIMDVTMGTVVYERADTTIAYQGGGVWRGERGGSVMVSPPEFRYRGGTLTLPLVLVRGQAASGGQMILRQNASTGRYPITGNQSLSNPLDDGRVNVTVTSEYYEAWGRYFAQRTAGDVTYDDPNETVQIELVVPFDEEFDDVVATTDQGGITVNGADPPPTPSATGVDYPSADSRIEDKVADCESGGCNSWTTDVDTDGTYYLDGDFSGDMDIDTSDGDVELVVNGKATLKNIDVEGSSGNVTLYVREGLAINGDVNAGSNSGTASRFRSIVHSDGTVSNNGNSFYAGLIYAPGSEVDYNGGGGNNGNGNGNGGGSDDPNLEGAVIAETIDINGNPNTLVYDDSVESVDLGLGSNAPTILYLHVSTTEVEVDD